MNAASGPKGDDAPGEPFTPDFSEGLETGLYLALLELLDEGLIITGDEVVFEANSAACRLLERDYRDIAGKPLSELFPSERAFLEARRRLFIQGEVRGSLQVSLPGGGQRALRFVAAARLRPGIHALILSPDIAFERPPAQPGGDSLWPRLAAALEQPVIVIDDASRVVAANAAALGALGLDRSALVGHALAASLHVEWPKPGAQPIARLRPHDPARSPIRAKILPGPKPGWQVLLLPVAGRRKAELPQRQRDTFAGASPYSEALGKAVSRAVAGNQLELEFQPLVDARDATIFSGEALLRWRHPELGVIPFRDFMGVARDQGLLARMGDWVLESACRHAAQWPAVRGRRPGLTINVAMEQLLQGNLAERVRSALEATGLDGSMLELDLDEQMLAEDDATVLETLTALKAMKVRLAIDDFGRGVASIPRLKRYPLTALKLDPALIKEIGKREESDAIVEAVTAMADVLGLEVFARGVETKAQQAFLSALGCHLQQGPLFGRPMSAEDFGALLTQSAGTAMPPPRPVRPRAP